MKNGVKLLACVFLASVCFLVGLFIGRLSQSDDIFLLRNDISNVTAATEPADFRIDINAATKAQLMELHGIGEQLAERIVAYREQNGPFVAIEDLMNVEGIGEKKLQTITEWIKVGG